MIEARETEVRYDVDPDAEWLSKWVAVARGKLKAAGVSLKPGLDKVLREVLLDIRHEVGTGMD